LDGFVGACPCATGDVSGQLPAALTFDNVTAFNDYFDVFMFGTTISFDVSLYGPALSAPDGVSTSGSTFAFSMFSNPLGTVPVLTSDTTDGYAFTVECQPRRDNDRDRLLGSNHRGSAGNYQYRPGAGHAVTDATRRRHLDHIPFPAANGAASRNELMKSSRAWHYVTACLKTYPL